MEEADLEYHMNLARREVRRVLAGRQPAPAPVARAPSKGELMPASETSFPLGFATGDAAVDEAARVLQARWRARRAARWREVARRRRQRELVLFLAAQARCLVITPPPRWAEHEGMLCSAGLHLPWWAAY